MKHKMLYALIIGLILSTAPLFAENGDDPDKNAEPPDSVYKNYCQAVHGGNINEIKNYVYSRSYELLWQKNANQILMMTKSTIPVQPRILSQTPEKQYQYNYMNLKVTGQTDKGQMTNGDVKMIVEGGKWKVYQEIWRKSP